MFKKVIPYIIGLIFFFIGFIVSPGRNYSNIKDRITKLEGISTEIRNAQQSIGISIGAIESSVGSIRTNAIGLTENYKRIENGVNRLSENDKQITEVIKGLGIRDTELKELSKEYRAVTEEFGRSISRIEERNK